MGKIDEVKKILAKFGFYITDEVATQICQLFEPKGDIICSRCDQKAEWVGIGDENLCQEHWEEYCGEQWAKTHWGTIEPATSRLLTDEVENKLVEEYMATLGWDYPTGKNNNYEDYDTAVRTVKWFLAKIASIVYKQGYLDGYNKAKGETE